MGKTILVVEDEVAIRRVLVTKLQAEGYGTLEAGDGEMGLTVALDKHPDLILLDVILPKLDGISLLWKLRIDGWGKNAEVIMLTNLSDAQSVADSLEKGVHDYLVKSDWKLDDLIALIKDKLQST